MNYEKLIETISEMINNDLIYTDGLSLTYTLDKNTHKKLDEHFFYKTNANKNGDFEYLDEFEVEIGGITIKFIRDEKE
jgi:hypothetical protein